MAPNGRSRKKTGLTRADAARDAMKAYGFSMRLINETIKELLQVYGEEGWVLIEEVSYKVLLDAILEKVEEQSKTERQDREQEENAEDVRCQEDINSTSHVHVEPETSPNQGTTIDTQLNEADALSFTNERVVDSQTLHSEIPPEHNFERGGALPIVVREIGKSLKAEELESIRAMTEVDRRNVGMVEGFRDSVWLGESSEHHNGWISSEEGEEDDDDDAYIFLTPEPLSEDLQRIFMEGNGQKRRKTRWDVTLEEPNLMVGTSSSANAINFEA